MDQLFNKYKCSSLDWTRAQKLRSEFLKPAEDLIKKNGFHKNGYQPALTEKSGAKSLTYGMSNVMLKDKNNCSSTGHHSLGEEFDSEAVSPLTVPKNETGRDTCPDITQRDSVSVPAMTQISNGQSSRPSSMQPSRRTECDATTFTLPTGAPNIISIQSRIINIPVFQVCCTKQFNKNKGACPSSICPRLSSIDLSIHLFHGRQQSSYNHTSHPSPSSYLLIGFSTFNL